MVSHPLCACFGFSSLVLVWFLSCFGRRYLRRGGVWVLSVCCAKMHSAVSDDATPASVWDVIFLLRPLFTHDSRYAPWPSPRPGVSTTLLFRDQ